MDLNIFSERGLYSIVVLSPRNILQVTEGLHIKGQVRMLDMNVNYDLKEAQCELWRNCWLCIRRLEAVEQRELRFKGNAAESFKQHK